jgi:hypothetical protein
METERLHDNDVIVKLSICPDCFGIVRCAVKQMMDDESKKEFDDEVALYRLEVKEMPLLEYRAKSPNWCECK